jgi:hypothetical protein
VKKLAFDVSSFPACDWPMSQAADVLFLDEYQLLGTHPSPHVAKVYWQTLQQCVVNTVF